MTREGRKEQRAAVRENDLLIVPDLEGITAFENFDDAGIAVERGVEAARISEDGLRAFSVDAATFAAWVERHRAGRRIDTMTIDRVEVTGLDRVSPKRVTRRLDSLPGTQVDVAVLQRDLQEIYRIGEFESVELRPCERGGRGDASSRSMPARRAWGPWFYRVGASGSANLKGRGTFTGNVLLRRPNLSPLGGEWKAFFTIGSVDQIDTDFYQPLEYTGRFSFHPATIWWMTRTGRSSPKEERKQRSTSNEGRSVSTSAPSSSTPVSFDRSAGRSGADQSTVDRFRGDRRRYGWLAGAVQPRPAG